MKEYAVHKNILYVTECLICYTNGIPVRMIRFETSY
jgi:hypothetical protein